MGMSAMTAAFVGVALTAIAYGCDLPWLKLLLGVFGFAMSLGMNMADAADLMAVYTSFGLTHTEALAVIEATTITKRFIAVAVSAFLCYSTLVELRDEVTYGTAMITAAEEIAEVIPEVIGGVATGLATGLLNSPILLIAGLILVAYLVWSNSGSKYTARQEAPPKLKEDYVPEH